MKEKDKITEELSSKLLNLAKLATKNRELTSEMTKIMHDYNFIVKILVEIYRTSNKDKDKLQELVELVEILDKKIYKVKL